MRRTLRASLAGGKCAQRFGTLGNRSVTIRRSHRAMLKRDPFSFRRRAEHTMGMPALLDDPHHKWTVDEVWALPDKPGERYECVDGELLVSPSPRWSHQRAVGWLYAHLLRYAGDPPRAGEVMLAPTDVRLDDFTLVQPDLFVAPLIGGRRPNSPTECPRFMLVIEVLSPSSQRADRVIKRRRYQRAADAYWIIDPDARLVERWLPNDERPEILTESINWQPTGRSEPLVVDLPALFREASGEAP
jgi:Uma2 family endonuclease